MRVTASTLLLFFCLTLIAYLLPWVVNPGVSLSPGGYDLAEWTTIHPAAMGESPPLLTGLLLRLPLVCLVVALTFFLTPTTRHRVIGGVIVILMGAALLPPFEFFGDPGNWNYRQQLMLTIVTVLGGILGLTGWLRSYRTVIGSGVAFAGAAASLLGLNNALTWMRQFDLPTQIGAGGILTALLLGVLVAVVWQTGQRSWQRRPIHAGEH